MDHRTTVGYVRVSTKEQNTQRQYKAIEEAGYTADRYFEDRVSGKNTNRPKLEEMLDWTREGDFIVVVSIDRLARSTQDLLNLIKIIIEGGRSIHFLKENLTFSSEEANARDNLMLGLLGLIAEFEREMIRERQLEGIAIAKAKGKYKGRTKWKISKQELERGLIWIENGIPKAEVARRLGIGRTALYQYIKDHEEGKWGQQRAKA